MWDAGSPETSIKTMAFNTQSSEGFAKHVEHSVRVLKMTYIDAVLDFCQERQLEPETIVPFLTTKIKTAIQQDAQKLHLIRPRRELPFDRE